MRMSDYSEDRIGFNIKEVRKRKGYSQEKLGERCDISNSQLSAYENGRKKPNLATIARIAKGLGVSIDRLYYGDETIDFIRSEPDQGRKIANSVYALWEMKVLYWNESTVQQRYFPAFVENPSTSACLVDLSLQTPISRLLRSLNEFENNKATYPDPDQYLEMLLSSVAIEINQILNPNIKSL